MNAAEKLVLAACRRLRIKIHSFSEKTGVLSPQNESNAKFLDSVTAEDVKEFKEILAAHQALYEALSAAKKVLELRRDAVRAQLYLLPPTNEDSVSAAKDNLSLIIGNLTGIIEKSDAALALADAAKEQK